MSFRRLFRPLPRSSRDLDAELREEIESHIGLCADALERKGLSRVAAEAAARARFGDFEESMRTLRASARQRSSRVQRRERLLSLKQDLVVAWRQARRSPGFSAAVVVTLALGVGANGAMFGLVDRLLLREPPGVAAPEQVRRLYWTQTFSWAGVVTQEVSNYADYTMLRAEARSWSDVAAHFSGEFTFGRGEAARLARGSMVTASYWSVLRPRPHLGRFFTADEDRPGNASRVAVLSQATCLASPSSATISGAPPWVAIRLRLARRSAWPTWTTPSSALRNGISVASTCGIPTCGCP
jgi:putative ABC transport system permease protein